MWWMGVPNSSRALRNTSLSMWEKRQILNCNSKQDLCPLSPLTSFKLRWEAEMANLLWFSFTCQLMDMQNYWILHECGNLCRAKSAKVNNCSWHWSQGISQEEAKLIKDHLSPATEELLWKVCAGVIVPEGGLWRLWASGVVSVPFHVLKDTFSHTRKAPVMPHPTGDQTKWWLCSVSWARVRAWDKIPTHQVS